MKKAPLYIKIDDNIELRLVEMQDAPAIFALVERNRPYLREWLPWLDQTMSITDEQAFIRLANEQYLSNHSPSCCIWYRGQIAGMISYHPINWVERKGELGYWLGAEFQGKGLVTRASKAMIDYGFHELKLNKVEIRCATGNTRSCAIPQRLGFTKEGIIKQGEWLYDHYVDLAVYGMLVHVWDSK